jgi:hypothetical protein
MLMKKGVLERHLLFNNLFITRPFKKSHDTYYNCRFTVTYFSGGLGYFIEAINDAKGTYSVDESFWQIRTELGRANVGKDKKFYRSSSMLYLLNNLFTFSS